MPKSYVRYDGDGNINGWSRSPDEGYTEELPEDHPDVVAFRTGPPEPPTPRETALAIADAIDGGNTAGLRTLIAQFPE